MKSVMGSGHKFSVIPDVKIPRSAFDRSHGYKTTLDSGYLVPVYADLVYPGDTFNLKMTSLCRMITPIVPIMDNIYLDSFFFAVPIRLIWEHWQNFNGERDDIDNPTDYPVPTIEIDAMQVGSLSDYLGIPLNAGMAGYDPVSFWHRAYNLIYNEWFRPQDLINPVVVDKDEGPDDLSDYVLLKRAKRHDYFTSCLPWPQKGVPVEIPLGTDAPIAGIGFNTKISENGGGLGGDFYETGKTAQTNYPQYVTPGTVGNTIGMNFDVVDEVPLIYADLSNATAATINSLRQAFQIQKLFERDARGGTRYVEIIRSHFGVVSPDFRLQRPEYLGGGTTRINVNPVAQTSETSTTKQGTLAAFAVGTAFNHGFVKSFTEHCVLLGIVNVRCDLTYQQGLDRMYQLATRYDFYWPSFAHLGEQSVLNREIFFQGQLSINPATGLPYDEETFGYQERYAELRYKPSRITGYFNSDAAGTLDIWHLAQDFSSLPELGQDFIEENPPIKRVCGVQDGHEFQLDCFFDLKCVRPLPTYSVPGLIDHF